MAELNRGRVLLVSMPAQGHVPSLFNLASRLVAASEGLLAVTIVNIESIHKTVAASYRVDELSDRGSINLEPLPFDYEVPKAVHAGFDRRPFLEAFDKLQEPFDSLVCRLKNRGVKICCIVADYFVQWTAAVAARHGITHVCFWPGSTSWCLIDYHIPLLAEKKAIPAKEDNSSTIVCVQGMKAFKVYELPFIVHEQSLQGLGLPKLLERRDRLDRDSWILANSFFQLEPEQDEAMQQLTNGRFLSVGPLVPVLEHGERTISLQAESPGCIDWLDKQAAGSILYVSFGSLATLPAKQVQELVHGLETSNQSFLWVARPEFLKNIPGEFIQSFRKRTMERGLIISWAPQVKVLSHPATGGFLTHCGWNSVLESISCGVPMLGWPCYSDQNLNCRLGLVATGIGLSIHGVNRMPGDDTQSVVSRERIAQLVVELMHGEAGRSARTKVKQLSEDARKAVKQDGMSQNKLKLFVQSLL